ncbi:hypothetical protein M231_05779 [Tremella mesenterica]|uniref:Uncharacterized protein n=1 Tax=Tremella mesenterica TaxID=5217 RepID=A0A4Q1BH75_TREME|nr:hypothetical protein M231_05779 [Tremella mesenterica]
MNNIASRHSNHPLYPFTFQSQTCKSMFDHLDLLSRAVKEEWLDWPIVQTKTIQRGSAGAVFGGCRVILRNELIVTQEQQDYNANDEITHETDVPVQEKNYQEHDPGLQSGTAYEKGSEEDSFPNIQQLSDFDSIPGPSQWSMAGNSPRNSELQLAPLNNGPGGGSEQNLEEICCGDTSAPNLDPEAMAQWENMILERGFWTSNTS